ncbi:O-antigen ligase family protein [Rhodococcus fascians]|uniref:O-antigen ligase family protein n=1 Tax=Rhodococcoides fascians TaxID=1828 RepID=UPI0024BA38AD|nr:O-antigen ligase family protein [Rhodococcus fascians]MDJ0428024.1 O-antigen ligase family protein [Rhodococcus fascians]
MYFALIPAFVHALQIIGTARLIKWLRNALVIHTAWVFPVMIGVLNPVQIPVIGGTAAFTTRGDYDIFLCGLAIAVVICDRRIGGLLKSVIVLGNLIPMALSGSRSGAIAGLIVVLVIAVLMRPFSKPAIGPTRLAATLAVTAIALPFVVIYGQNPPTWAVGIQKILPSSSDTYESGQNTWNARVYAWGRLVTYTTDEPTRNYFGSGFGSNPVRDSGALQFLSGDPQVRAGHNVFVTWFAFLGVVGLIFAIAALACFVAASLAPGKPTVLMTTLGRAIMVGILLTAMVGVILESPFGYMTFTLACAMAIARPVPGPAIRGKLRPKIIDATDAKLRLVSR